MAANLKEHLEKPKIVINSWNEWDPLKTVVLGTSLGAQVPSDERSLRAINYADWPLDRKAPVGPYPDRVIEEAEEDLSRIEEVLTKLGIGVLRPNTLSGEIQTPRWSTSTYYQYCPRDHTLVVGNTLIESPMPLRSRQLETWGLKDIFLEGFRNGARWISAPKPALLDECYNIEEVDRDHLTLNELEPCFDAANVLRCGYDLFYLVSNSGNRLGGRWLQETLGPEYRVHYLEDIYSFMHLDSTISFLRPGLVLLNPDRINESNIPEVLRPWDKIWAPPPVDIGFYPPYEHASEWIGVNLLMISPTLALVDQSQQPLIKELNRQKIEVIEVSLRHARTLGGGLHCVTLDLFREGGPEKYF